MSVFAKGKDMKRQIVAALIAVLLSGFAIAQEADQLEVQTIVQKEVVSTNDAGESETKLVEATTVVPGERVVYTTTVRNVGSEPAENVVITNPIASELTYENGSAFGAGMAIEFSVDGGTTWASPDELTVVGEDGTARAATEEDYTHVRWVMQNDLAAGAQMMARFSAVLD